VCELLGVRRGVVVITKIDRVDADVAELAALEAVDLARGRLFGADGASPPAVVRCSATTGAGLDELRRSGAALARGDRAPRRRP
jgi:selenocysteine-specific translation elongation factor